MSSVFQFVLGITLGILITLALVHRYKKPEIQYQAPSEDRLSSASTEAVGKMPPQLLRSYGGSKQVSNESFVGLSAVGAQGGESRLKTAAESATASAKIAEKLKAAHGWLADGKDASVVNIPSTATGEANIGGFSDEALQQQVRVRAGAGAGTGRRAKRGKLAPTVADDIEQSRAKSASGGGISVAPRDRVSSTVSGEREPETVVVPTTTAAGAAQSKASWVPGREGAFLNFKNSALLGEAEGEGGEEDFVAAKGVDASATALKAVEPSGGGSGSSSGAVSEIPELVDTAGRKRGRKGRRRERGQGLGQQGREGGGGGINAAASASGPAAEVTEDGGSGSSSEFGLGIIDPAASVERVSKGLSASGSSTSTSSSSISSAAAAATVSLSASSSAAGGAGSDSIKLQSKFFTVDGQRIPTEDVGKYSGELYASPPLTPYHAQARRPALHPPYIPSLQSVKEQRAALTYKPDQVVKGMSKELPNMSRQKAVFEPENLKLHLCNGVFEAYSASYLTTKQHMLEVKSEQYNLSWVNCEMASFIHMRESKNFLVNPNGQGMIIQSLDVLDFSAIHLSAYERSSKKYRHRLWKSKAEQKTEWTKIEPVKETARILEESINPLKSGKPLVWSAEAKKTVVIMPFLGGAMGAGHSELGNRFEYLRACFWSFYEFIPNIVAGVSRKEDVEWGMKHSGLPFYEMILIENLPKGAGLPVGTTQRVKAKLLSGEWDFDYVFFTESDQILISRQLPMMYDHLKSYPSRMILPHRLMPYSDRVMKEVHSKNIDESPNKWMQESCCLPRQNCEERKTWRPLNDPSIPVINYYGLYVPLGNVNFLMEEYRGCTMSSYIGDYCP